MTRLRVESAGGLVRLIARGPCRVLALVPVLLSSMLLPHAEALAQGRQPTTQTSIGLFYQPGAPETADLWREGDKGRRLALQGRVLDTSGRPLSGALVELWHADSAGSVDESRYRAAQRTGERGRFGIRTVLPGHIEMARGNAVFGPRHIHVRVTRPGFQPLVSLIFFRGDEYLRSTPYPELVITLDEATGEQGDFLFGKVELVLQPE